MDNLLSDTLNDIVIIHMRQNAMSAVFNAILKEDRFASAILNEVEWAKTEEAVEIFRVNILVAREKFAI